MVSFGYMKSSPLLGQLVGSVLILMILAAPSYREIARLYTGDQPAAAVDGSSDTKRPSEVEDLEADAKIGRVVLTWDASKDNVGVRGYKIYKGTASDKTSYYTSVTSTSFTDILVAPSTKYYYRVSAYDFAGNESKNDDESVKTPSWNPTEFSSIKEITQTPVLQPAGQAVQTGSTLHAPEHFEIADVYYTPTRDLLLRWPLTDEGVVKYNIYRDNVLVKTIWNTFESERRATTTLPTYTGTYTYTLTALDASGNESPHSNPAVYTSYGVGSRIRMTKDIKNSSGVVAVPTGAEGTIVYIYPFWFNSGIAHHVIKFDNPTYNDISRFYSICTVLAGECLGHMFTVRLAYNGVGTSFILVADPYLTVTSVALDPLKKPWQNFDLTTWKIQLTAKPAPTDYYLKEVSTSPSDQAAISPWFFTDTDGSMAFWLDATKTNDGTWYRTELREVMNGESTGTNWSVHTGTSTLKATIKIKATPTFSGNQITILQIHPLSGNPLLRLAWYATPYAGKNLKVHYKTDAIGSVDASAYCPNTDISLDKYFDAEILVIKGKLTVKVNGQTCLNNFAINSSWYEKNYFKAGNYASQSWSGIGQVNFKKLEVYHSEPGI
jgi:hypothetical protein